MYIFQVNLEEYVTYTFFKGSFIFNLQNKYVVFEIISLSNNVTYLGHLYFIYVYLLYFQTQK